MHMIASDPAELDAHGHSGKVPASRTALIAMTVILAATFVATLVGLIMLWPDADMLPGKRSVDYEGSTHVSGVVLGIESPGSLETGDPAKVKVRIDQTGEEILLDMAPTVVTPDIVGAKMRLVELPPAPEVEGDIEIPTHIFVDFHRSTPLLLLGILFAVAVVAVARLKGLAALIGLAGALATVWFFTLPTLLAGRPALAVALVTASAVLFIVVYLAHGISVKSSTALLGTLLGIALVTALAMWAIPASHLIPGADEEMSMLAYQSPGMNLRGILLCGMVLSGVGVLNDVTITQASSVWELRAAAPHESRWSIFVRAMRIGRDHVASTVYTIAFAYVGSALGLLLLASTFDHRFLDLVTYDEIAAEIVSIAVASIGLVLAIPLTTAIAALLAGDAKGAPAYVVSSS